MDKTALALTDPAIPATSKQPEGFGFQALGLISAIATADDYLLWSEYLDFHRFAQSLLTASELESATQRAAALRLFLPGETSEQRLDAVLRAAERECVSMDLRKRLVDHVLQVLEGSPQHTDAGLSCARRLIEGLRVPLSPFAERLDRLSRAAREEASAGASPLSVKSLANRLRGAFSSLNKRARSEVVPGKSIFTRPPEIDAARERATELVLLGRTIQRQRLVEEAQRFLDQLQTEPCRIVLVGEFKHGKSTLFNRLAGASFPYSAVGESVATTATLVTLRYSEEQTYSGRWLDEAALERVRAYLSANPSERSQQYLRQLDSTASLEDFCPGGTIGRLESLETLPSFTTTSGKYSCAVERIEVGLPVETLKAGAILVDTPGSNETTHVREEITRREALNAHCVLFVMRADKFKHESERAFLQSLLRSGRVLRLALVITHVDRVTETRESLRQQAREFLIDLGGEVRSLQAIQGAPIFCLDQTRTDDSEFSDLWSYLQQAVDECSLGFGEARWSEERLDHLRRVATEELTNFRNEQLERLPGEDELAGMQRLTESFEALAREFWQRLLRTLEGHRDRLQVEANQKLGEARGLKELLLQDFDRQIRARIEQLGERWHKEEHWKEFDRNPDRVIRPRLEQLARSFEASNEFWNRELTRFAEELSALTSQQAPSLRHARGEFDGLCETRHGLLSAMCRLDQAATAVEQTASVGLFLGTGALLLTGSPVFFTALAGLALSPVGAIAVAGAATAWIASKLTSDKEARREKFIHSKLANASKALDKLECDVVEKVEQYYLGVWSSFQRCIDQRYGPFMQEVQASAEEARLRCQLTQRIRADTLRLVEMLEMTSRGK